MLLMIDNYDSFTFNLVQYFSQLHCEVVVKRNDEISIAQIEALNPDKIILSPGPGSPDDAGICLNVITHFKYKKPILGVCLGHQALAQCFGARIELAKKIMHAKTSRITHNATGLFAGLPQQFIVGRYHSLIVAPHSLPEALALSAWTDEQEIMAIQHRQLPLYGVQFHPESILSEYGLALLGNFVKTKKRNEQCH